MTTKQYLTWGGLLCGAVVIILIALWGFTDVLTPVEAPSATVPVPAE